jgi:hypothetical protein
MDTPALGHKHHLQTNKTINWLSIYITADYVIIRNYIIYNFKIIKLNTRR